MNKLVKLGIGVASSALLMAAFAANTFAADLVISGNGDDSTNTIKVNTTCTTKVIQNSNTNVSAAITASSSTGGNVASGNTGGNVGITTGDADTTVAVSVTGGSNTAALPDCCCDPESAADQKIKDNGADSTNKIDVKSKTTLTTKQKSKTTLSLAVTAKSRSGKNKAKDNTGPGDVTIDTGASSTTVGVAVEGGSNSL